MESPTVESKFLNALRKLSSGAPETIKAAIAEPNLWLPTEGTQKKAASLTSINIFQHPDSHPIVLDLVLLKRYGPEWLSWETEVLAWRIPQDFKTTSVSDLNLEKVQAIKSLHFVDTPWEEWQVFLWTCMAVNGVFPDFEVMQVPTAAQALIAVSIFNRIRQDVSWSEEVKDYLGVVWKADGVLCTIEPADFFTVPAEGLVVNCSDVSSKWPEVKKAGRAPSEATPEAEQLRRLLALHTYLEEDRERLDRQLILVAND